MEHTTLAPGTGIRHEWKANVRTAGSRTLLEVLYEFDVELAEEDVTVTWMSDLLERRGEVHET